LARRLSLVINLMMLVAAFGAAALGQWSKAGAIVFPFPVAQALVGGGAQGRVVGWRIVLGNHRPCERRRLCTPARHGRLGPCRCERGQASTSRTEASVVVAVLADGT
jgi:hypothetical protein